MSDITDWIEEAQTDLGCRFMRSPDTFARSVVEAARAKFVNGNPRVWWLSLSQPFTVQDSEDRSFLDVVPEPTERVWLIIEDDSDSLPVYDVSPEEVDLLRKNCPPFEYYVTDHCFRWLIAESDHDKFFICVGS